MLIGINGYEAVIPRFGYDKETGLPRRVGSAEYCFKLLINLYKLDKQNEYIIYLPKDPSSDFPEERDNWHYKIVKQKKMWTLIGLTLEFLLKRSKPDVFFFADSLPADCCAFKFGYFYFGCFVYPFSETFPKI